MKLRKPTRPAAKENNWLFKEVERPSFTDSLKFPDNIAAISSKEVSNLLGRYTAMHAYAISELSKVDQELLRYESEIYVRRNNIQRMGGTHNWRKTETDTQVRLDMLMQKLVVSSKELESKKVAISSFVTIYEKYTSALSRELTRRTSEARL